MLNSFSMLLVENDSMFMLATVKKKSDFLYVLGGCALLRMNGIFVYW